MSFRQVLGGLAVSALLAGPALAADLRMPVKAAPAPVIAVYNWTGFYIGGQVGYAWGRAKQTGTGGFTSSYDADGLIGGGHVGYLWQMNTLVFGVEGDVNGSQLEGNDARAGGSLDTTKLRVAGSVRGILGLAAAQWLFYGTGGWAIASINHAFDGPSAASINEIHNGWTAGGGVKYAFAPNWVAGVEYRQTRYSDERHETPRPNFDRVVGLRANEVTFRLSYKFGAPVVARY